MKKKTSNYVGPKIHFPHKLYILIRNDIPSMNPGKAMAQAAHAANKFVADYGHLDTVQTDWMGVDNVNQCKRPFGTTVVVAVDGPTLHETLSAASMVSIPCGEVYDETYPYVVNKEIANLIPSTTNTAAPIYKEDGKVVLFRNELTCGYAFVVDGSSIQEELFGALPLHP